MDDDTVIELTPEEWHAGAQRALNDLGLTYAELEGQARRRDFTSAQAHSLWTSIGGTVRPELLPDTKGRPSTAAGPQPRTENTMSNHTEHRPVGFEPAPSGWRAVFLKDAEPGYDTVALAGWLLVEEVSADRYSNIAPATTPAPEYRRRKYVAAVVMEGELADVGGYENFWFVADPDATPPTAEDVAAEKADRRAARLTA